MTKLTQEQQVFATDNMPLVHKLMKQHRRRWAKLDYEDFKCAAYLALTKAAQGFDEAKGYKFSALLTRCLINEWRDLSAQMHMISIPQHYEEGRRDPARGFPEARERAKRMQRESNTDQEGRCVLTQSTAPDMRTGWAYEITAMLPDRHRQLAEKGMLQGVSGNKLEKVLGVGFTGYCTLRDQTKVILKRLIERNELNAI